MKNPIKEYIRRHRIKKYCDKWNSDIYDNIEHGESLPLDERTRYYFKWNQLVSQEILMFINLGKQVKRDDIDWIVDRRGFDKDMENYLIELVKHVGLGKML